MHQELMLRFNYFIEMYVTGRKPRCRETAMLDSYPVRMESVEFAIRYQHTSKYWTVDFIWLILNIWIQI